MVVNRRHVHRYVESKRLSLNLQLWRLRVMWFFLGLAFVGLFARGFYLLAVQGDFLQEEGSSRYLREIEISAMRGRIMDRNGKLLAVSTPMRAIWAIPQDAREMTDAQKTLLADLLKTEPAAIDQKIDVDKTFVYLNRQVAPEVAQKIAALKIPGIHQEQSYRRFYPQGEITSHIVGFTGIEEKGLEGVELAFDADLPGVNGKRFVLRDRKGHIIEDVKAIHQPLNGKDITLALDLNIQYTAFSYLKNTVLKHRAKAGSVVVLDAQNGDILAMVNYPAYNPNNPLQSERENLRNRAMTDTFEPGSTLKPFAVALAIDKGTHRYDTTVDTGKSGTLTIGKNTISDVRAYGALTVAQIIQKSSNIGTAKIGLSQDSKTLWELYDALGFGKPPNLGFPGEGKGRLRFWKNWQPIEQATMSYGHGISVSLLQLARAYSVFARNGDMVSLSLKKSQEVKSQGQPIFSDQTAREMRAMLELAVTKGGTGTRAQVPGYHVGGKTGTANKIEAGAYVKKYVSSFVGIAPLSNPRLVVAVMIDEPSENGFYGGLVAAPLFSEIMQMALNYLGVPPDKLEDTRGEI